MNTGLLKCRSNVARTNKVNLQSVIVAVHVEVADAAIAREHPRNLRYVPDKAGPCLT